MKKSSAGISAAGLALATALGAAAVPSIAAAQLSANVAVVSDYRFRGVSQTFKKPALQGGADYVHESGAYIGTWASMVDKDFITDSKGIELDIYGGYKFPLGAGWTGDVGLLQYLYPGESFWNTTELYLGASWEWFSVKYSHSISKRTFGIEDSRGSGYLEVNATYPLSAGLNLVGHLGYTNFKNADNYSDYKLGVTYDWAGFTWGAAVIGTSEDFTYTKPNGKTKDLGTAGLILSVSKTF